MLMFPSFFSFNNQTQSTDMMPIPVKVRCQFTNYYLYLKLSFFRTIRGAALTDGCASHWLCYIQFLDFTYIFFTFKSQLRLALPPRDTLLFRNDILVIVMYFHFESLYSPFHGFWQGFVTIIISSELF